MTVWRMRIACWITMAIDTPRICVKYYLSKATMVVRTRLIVTFIRTLSVLSGRDAV